MFTLYNVVSEDGFIADSNEGEEFIPDDLWQNFLDLCLEYNVLAVGRKTYDTIQTYEEVPLEAFEALNIRKIVLTNDVHFSPKEGYEVMFSPEELAKTVPNTLISSGPTLNNYLFEHHLVGKVIWHKVPVFIQNGTKPFKDEFKTSLRRTIPSSPLADVTVEEYLVL